jgi:hypothetical protein
MRRFYIVLNERTLYQLAEVAERERREPRQQAAYMLERAVATAATPDNAKSDTVQDLAVAGA